jgi:sterol desaturase/sphingolipid hydroxylase (fatty acid hydroxylase superfamily)
MNWHWNNILLINDNIKSTIDFWITEVIPTLLFAYLSQQWWIFLLWYFYCAFIQEKIEHNKNYNKYPFHCAGLWHLIHHRSGKCNFSIFVPFWDIVFKTNTKI